MTEDEDKSSSGRSGERKLEEAKKTQQEGTSIRSLSNTDGGVGGVNTSDEVADSHHRNGKEGIVQKRKSDRSFVESSSTNEINFEDEIEPKKPKSKKKKKKRNKSDRSLAENSSTTETKLGKDDITSQEKPKNNNKKKSDRSLVEDSSASEVFENNFQDETGGNQAPISPAITPTSKRKKKPNSTSSMGSGGFLGRLDTSLIASVEFSINENEEFGIIDVEKERELNRQKEKNRKKMKKNKNKHDGVDPRLFPSYYDKADGEDDESSMGDIEKSSPSVPRSNYSIRSNRTNTSVPQSNYSIRSNRTNNQVVSAIQGRKIVKLSVIVYPTKFEGNTRKRKIDNFSNMLADSRREGVVHGVRPYKDTTAFSSPIRLLEIEDGRAILVKERSGDKYETSKTTMSVAAVKQTIAPEGSDVVPLGARGDGKTNTIRKRISDGVVRDFRLSKAERAATTRQGNVRRRLVRSMDDINTLNLGQQIQSSIPFLSGYESYLLGQIIEVLFDSVAQNSKAKIELNEMLRIAFKNYHVSRVLVENIERRWDFSWHWFNQICKCRLYDAWGQLPILGITKFPTTENFPTADFWMIEKLWIPDSDKALAQNISAEYNDFEATKRNLFGSYIGRLKTNDFRIETRFPVDESIVHNFVVSPMSTMTNNGAVHVLRLMAKHWQTILAQPLGNFTHHRLEQLDPFEIMRFHVPIVCVVLASLRGRNLWDARVLGPFIQKCQMLTTTSTAKECLNLAKEFQSSVVPNLCAGVGSIEQPLSQWLEAIQESCYLIEEQAKEIYKEVTGVEIGLQFGYNLVTQVSWQIPSDKELEKAILLGLKGKYTGEIVHERNIRRALLALTPRDKRTLTELIKMDLQKSKVARVLVDRVKNLLKRDIRRECLNDAIRELSTGEVVNDDDLTIDDWYWLNEENDKKSVYIFEKELTDEEILVYRFVRVDTREIRVVRSDDLEDTKCRQYIPVAESIVRAQRCFMNIELDFCHKFKYNAFAEFNFLRTALKRLAVVSQIFCDELDSSRLNILQEVKTMNQNKVLAGDLEPGNTYYIYNSLYDVYAPFVCQKKFSPTDPEWQKLEQIEMVKVLPQSTIVVGSGITGLITTIHCAESVLASGGNIQLFDTSGANAKGGSVFERAQIVRLDPRWVAMLRYYLGTVFEETFIPTSTESYAHLGNSLVDEGFVEITIKDLECLLHAEVTKLWSKDIIRLVTGSKVFFDSAMNSLVKLGEHLEVGDKLLRKVNPSGNPCKEYHRWTIAAAQNAETLDIGDLCIGEEYDVFVKKENSVLPFKLVDVDHYTRTYKFESLNSKFNDIDATPYDLPPVYPKGSKRQFKKVSIKCETKQDSGSFHYDHISQSLEGQKFVVDIGHNHVVECVGNPYASPSHFQVTPSEPCGFCCISRLNSSMGRQGIFDIFNAVTVPNTRMAGDPTKMVRQLFIAGEMVNLMDTENWQRHFIKVIDDSDFSSLNDKDPIIAKLLTAMVWHAEHAGNFRRQTLQIKLSETTDNFYLRMELPREYQKWKNDTVDHLVLPIKGVSKAKKRSLLELKETLKHNIDLLWFEACLEVLRHGNVYDADQVRKIRKMHLINSQVEEKLNNNFTVGDSFRVSGKMNRKFEIILKNKKGIFARNADGVVQKFDKNIEVFREGCLSRAIDGDSESKVAIATFPMSQYVNNRPICLNNETKGYVFAPIGDQQSTSHFMHYSALSGGCLNVVLFNKFLRSAFDGVPLMDRFQLYSKETNWSNGEVIQRGTMTSFGQDAFLRPGFSYRQGLKYIYSQAYGGKNNLNDILSQTWKTKFSASMVPRGMELNKKFIKTLKGDSNFVIFDLFLEGAMNDNDITWHDGLEESLKARRDDLSGLQIEKNDRTFWEQFLDGLSTSLDDASQRRLKQFHGDLAKQMEQFVREVIEFAKESHLYNKRSSQELWNQPKPVDSIVDDFAIDGQNLPFSLARSTAFCASSVALVLYASLRNSLNIYFEVLGIIISFLNVFLSFGILLKSDKYKTRNAKARDLWIDKLFLDLKKVIFRAMDIEDRKANFDGINPFFEELEGKKKKFVEDVVYYGLEDPDEFIYDYKRLLERSDQPAAFKHFQKLLATYYIPDVYQVNSYVQDSLVELYKVCDEIHTFMTQIDDRFGREEKGNIPHLFSRVSNFYINLKLSSDSRLGNSNLYLTCRYLWSLVCCSSSTREFPMSSIESESAGIIKEMRLVSKAHKGSILKRQIQDMEYLRRAMLETDKGAMVFVWAALIFVASTIYGISRIIAITVGNNSFLTAVGLWSQLVSVFAALVAFRYYAFCFCHSLWLWVKLGVKISAKKLDKDTRHGLRKIKSFVFVQYLLTIIQLCLVLSSITAVSWCVAATAFPDKIWVGKIIPIYIALVAFCIVMGAMVFSLFLEFIFGYNLPPKLGEVVYEAFREEIEYLYVTLATSQNRFDTKLSLERITREYVAREFLHKYRFDTIFGSDRCGSILQCLQCGIEKREEKDADII